MLSLDSRLLTIPNTPKLTMCREVGNNTQEGRLVHTHLAECRTQASTQYVGQRTGGEASLTKGAALPTTQVGANFGSRRRHPPRQKSTHRLPVYIYMISHSHFRPTLGV